MLVIIEFKIIQITKNMKKISFIIITTVAILAVSCKKDLEQLPLSQATVPTFYAQPVDFIQAVNATYNSLRGYPDRQLFLSEVRSDNIYPTNAVGRDPDPINNFSTGIAPNVYVEERSDVACVNDPRLRRAGALQGQVHRASSGGESPKMALIARRSSSSRFLRSPRRFQAKPPTPISKQTNMAWV